MDWRLRAFEPCSNVSYSRARARCDGILFASFAIQQLYWKYRFVVLVKKMSCVSCIICLEGNKLTSTPSGCEKIRWAANLRKDTVYERLKSLKPDDTFSYHMTNQCYKNYTHKEHVMRAVKKEMKLKVHHRVRAIILLKLIDSVFCDQN